MLLEIEGLDHVVGRRQLLRNLSLRAASGESVAVTGPSGCGKTTLLQCIAGIIEPRAGVIALEGVRLTSLSRSERSSLRLRRIGLVFQFGELLPELSVEENVALPLILAGANRASAVARGRQLLATMRLAERARSSPSELSGGETQRVAIARALVSGPGLILADEPTGSLDQEAAREVAIELIGAARDSGAALVLVTHNPTVAALADRQCAIEDGCLVDTAAALP